MIYVDNRKGSGDQSKGGVDLAPIIERLGVPAERMALPYGDACFEGNGPEGRVMMGVERKSLHDMLHCIDDSRFSAHQKVGMGHMYKVSILMVEGVWAVGKPPHMDGFLIESQTDGMSFGLCKYRTQPVRYSKLYRYLLSVALTGVIITYPRNVYETAFQIVECFHYFQKKWEDHTSMREVQKLVIPSLNAKPSLCLRWANDIDDVGVKLGERVAGIFKTPIRLATASEEDWVKVRGISARTALKIVRQIQGA